MESMSNTQKNPRFRLLSVWQVWTSVISELQFFLAVVCLFHVHDNTVHLTAEPPCQSHRVRVIRSSSGRHPVVSIDLLFLCSLCNNLRGPLGVSLCRSAFLQVECSHVFTAVHVLLFIACSLVF